MGSSNSVQISHKVWPKGTSHEAFTNIFNRQKAIPAYQYDEPMSLGRCDVNVFDNLYNKTIHTELKGETYKDGLRKNYSDTIKCCLIRETSYLDNGVVYSCSNDTKNYNNNVCDFVLRDACTNGSSFNCKTWLRSTVQRFDIETIKLFTEFAKTHFDHEYSNAFLVALRDFATTNNKLDAIADEIIDSYSSEIKKEFFKCAFPISEISNKEQEVFIPKECWYKECALAPIERLKTKNINNRQQCSITLCDIDIKKLNMSTQNIQIICNNKFKEPRIDIVNNPITQDIEQIFFIPTVKNTVIPLLTLLGLIIMTTK